MSRPQRSAVSDRNPNTWEALHGAHLDDWSNALYTLAWKLHEQTEAYQLEGRDIESLNERLSMLPVPLRLEIETTVLELISTALAEGAVIGWALHATQPTRLEDFKDWFARAIVYGELDRPLTMDSPPPAVEAATDALLDPLAQTLLESVAREMQHQFRMHELEMHSPRKGTAEAEELQREIDEAARAFGRATEQAS